MTPSNITFTPPALFCLHWLSFTVYCDEKRAREIMVAWNLEDTLVNSGHGGGGFRIIHQGLGNCQLKTQPVGQRKADNLTKDYDVGYPNSWEDFYKKQKQQMTQKRLDDNREKMRKAVTYCGISLPGEIVASIHPDLVKSVFQDLMIEGIRFNITRLDFAFDTQNFSAAQVWWALKRDKYKSRVHDDSITRYQNKTGTGDTIYIGSRDSLQLIRCYTKLDKESLFADEPFTRFEFELHDERATHAFVSLLAYDYQEWAGFGAKLIRGFIEFDRPWWRELMGDLTPVWLKLTQPQPTIERAEQWLYEQVSKTLATYLEAKKKKHKLISKDGEISYDFMQELNELLQHGRSNLSKKHLAMIEHYDPAAQLDYALFTFDAGARVLDFVGGDESKITKKSKDYNPDGLENRRKKKVT